MIHGYGPAEFTALVEIISSRPILTRKDLAVRYGRTLRTIDEWHSNGTLPPAVYLRGSDIPMWRPCDLMRAECKKKLIKRAMSVGQLELLDAGTAETGQKSPISI